MRILVVSNFYPPQYMGGYELGCRDVVEGLRARGHEITVLTSTYQVDGPITEGHVLRWMASSFEWKAARGLAYVRRLMRQEKTNQAAFQRAYAEVKPDLIYFWGESYNSVSLLYAAQSLAAPSCFFVSDAWLEYLESDPWCSLAGRRSERSINRIGKAVLLPVLRAAGYFLPGEPLRCAHVQFASDYLKQAALGRGRPVRDAEVIHWGIDPGLFPFRAPTVPPRPTRRLLFVGQVLEHKGVHTAVEALARLRAQPGLSDVTLTIAGGTAHTDYGTRLRAQIAALGLDDAVSFTGKLPRESLPAVYAAHDVLVFPSIWAEPFGITPLEAMAAGLAVVATPTGGSPEMFADGENALLFAPEDAAGCAAAVGRLLTDTAFYERVRAAGRATVEERFTFTHLVDQVEQSLERIVQAP